MRHLLILPMLLAALGARAEGTEGSSVKNAAKAVTSSVVTFTKNVVSGMSEGATDGRKTTGSADGAVLVSKAAELDKHLEVKTLKFDTPSKGEVVAELALRNKTDRPVRVIELLATGAVLLIDKDGFATRPEPVEAPAEITVPAKAMIKTRLRFTDVSGAPVAVRLFGKDYRK